MLVHTSIRMGTTWLVGPYFPHRPAEASLDRPDQALSNMLGQIPKANRLLSDWVLHDPRISVTGWPCHCSAALSFKRDSKFRNSNLFRIGIVFGPKDFSAQADVWLQGGQAVRAINRTRKDSRDSHTRFNDRVDWVLDRIVAPPILSKVTDRGASALTKVHLARHSGYHFDILRTPWNPPNLCSAIMAEV